MLRSKVSQVTFLAAIFPFAYLASAEQPQSTARTVPVRLAVPPGTPLRLYITHRVWYRSGETVEAKLAEPVWAFDRIVLPEGTLAKGVVSELDPVSNFIRARAIVGGDFTPLKEAKVSFSTLVLPNGRRMEVRTEDSAGLATIYVPSRAAKRTTAAKSATQASQKPATRMAYVKETLHQAAINQVNARTQGLYDLVRGPNKREWVENFLLSKLPYHPQWYRTNTRFDAVLTEPLDFGTVAVPVSDLNALGTDPAADSIANVRIVSTLSSADARLGEPVEGVLSQPLFSAGHKLVLPEGTRVSGKITLAQGARWFHRGGKLRFDLDTLEVPAVAVESGAASGEVDHGRRPARAQLAALETDPHAARVDPEGTVTATESKTRFLRPAIAGLVAVKSLDNDSGKQTATGTGASNNAGRGAGGFSGFGLLGTVASLGPHQIAGALGFYGLAWSVYSNVVSRGREVVFEKNTATAIRFGTPRH